jgi:hypothetical protein
MTLDCPFQVVCNITGKVRPQTNIGSFFQLKYRLLYFMQLEYRQEDFRYHTSKILMLE